ncbi:NADP-dependent D-sorbitol-6-phosphate dehydrogenase-like [Alnus glutinosa]|uniref:NADP-dependent D-sorbitol-6-phosphate dehydrogenase-like n=1 Tax=Alnus glutinosa TaxID=3517 RepID=UPI002D772715|nr:NADP-dependent D-sorbitol-6-phosphate dehydrogenase-like [Alnus glutinosa]
MCAYLYEKDNYDIFLTRDCLAYSKVKPAVNQISTHPCFQRDSLVKFCQKHGICVTAHAPLGGAAANNECFGTASCLDDPVLKELAAKYKRTVAQIVLRWGIHRNTVIIPKTAKLERLEHNFQVFDLELSKEDV